jgi:hypothetical protein
MKSPSVQAAETERHAKLPAYTSVWHRDPAGRWEF